MAERASVFEGLQLGVETTPGTPPAAGATKKLTSLILTETIDATTTTFKTSGGKFPVTTALGETSWTAKADGPLTFNEFAYILSSAVQGHITPTEIGTTGAYTWTFKPNQSAPDTLETYEIQTGSTVRAQQVNYASFTDLEITVTRKEAKFTASLIGQRLQDGITLTAAPTTIPIVPMTPNMCTVTCDTTAAAIGTTKLTRLLSFKFTMKGRLGPLWVINKTNPSWAATVEKAPTTEVTLELEATTTGMEFLTRLRTGTKLFLRLSFVGPVITGVTTYLFQLTLCCEVTKSGAFADKTGVYAVPFTLTVIESTTTTFGAAIKAKLVNKISTL